MEPSGLEPWPLHTMQVLYRAMAPILMAFISADLKDHDKAAINPILLYQIWLINYVLKMYLKIVGFIQ